MTEHGPEKKGISVGAIFGGLAGLLALIFIVQNTQSTNVSFLAWDFEFPMWVWALILFLLGAAAGYGFSWHRRRQRRR